MAGLPSGSGAACAHPCRCLVGATHVAPTYYRAGVAVEDFFVRLRGLRNINTSLVFVGGCCGKWNRSATLGWSMYRDSLSSARVYHKKFIYNFVKIIWHFTMRFSDESDDPQGH
jgi:hypothetical protein